jgi:hypothetical protein
MLRKSLEMVEKDIKSLKNRYRSLSSLMFKFKINICVTRVAHLADASLIVALGLIELEFRNVDLMFDDLMFLKFNVF